METKVAVITGGSTGIGKEVAMQLAKDGVAVIVAGRNKERGESAVAELVNAGAQALFVQTDVGVEQQVKNLADQAMASFGRIDFLFNNAGTEGIMGTLDQNTEEVIDEVLSSNIKGVVLCIKHVLPVMMNQGRGVIINTASFVGTTMPLPVAVVYGASKAAVLSITRSVAVSGAEKNVQVFAVCPWFTDTPMADRLTGHQAEAKAGFGASINPSGKIATTVDIAGVVVSLFTGKIMLKSGDAVLVDSKGAMNKIIPMAVE
jgi:NAD(P)-dependent dehydrogenase (short-subunit alcohol dehydrogenase family)